MNKDFKLTEANVYRDIINNYDKPLEKSPEVLQTPTKTETEIIQPKDETPKEEKRIEEPKKDETPQVEEKKQIETVVQNQSRDTTVKQPPTDPMYKLLRGKKHPLYQTTNSTYGSKKPTKLNRHLKWHGLDGTFTKVRIIL